MTPHILRAENGDWLAIFVRSSEGRAWLWLCRKGNGANHVHMRWYGREAWDKFREWRWVIGR